MLDTTFPRITYFTTGSLYLSTTFAYFTHPTITSPCLWPCNQVLCIHEVLFFFFLVPHISEIIWLFSFSVWLLFLSIMPPKAKLMLRILSRRLTWLNLFGKAMLAKICMGMVVNRIITSHRCSHPNLTNLWICYIMWPRDFAGMVKLMLLRWETILV